jgi:hypothetical protein
MKYFQDPSQLLGLTGQMRPKVRLQNSWKASRFEYTDDQWTYYMAKFQQMTVSRYYAQEYIGMQTCSSVTEGLRLLTSRVRSRALCSLGNTTPALCACGPCSGQYAPVRTPGLQRCQCGCCVHGAHRASEGHTRYKASIREAGVRHSHTRSPA